MLQEWFISLPPRRVAVCPAASHIRFTAGPVLTPELARQTPIAGHRQVKPGLLPMETG